MQGKDNLGCCGVYSSASLDSGHYHDEDTTIKSNIQQKYANIIHCKIQAISEQAANVK